jgi:hypothetical protein
MRRRLLVGHLLPLYCSTLSFVRELSFFLRLRTFVLPSWLRASAIYFFPSFARLTVGVGYLPGTFLQSFETVMYGLGTLSFLTIKHNLSDVH